MLVNPQQWAAMEQVPGAHRIVGVPQRVLPVVAVEAAVHFYGEGGRHGVYFAVSRAAGTIWTNLYQQGVRTERLIIVDLHRRFGSYKGALDPCMKTLQKWGHPYVMARRLDLLRDEERPPAATTGVIIIDNLGTLAAAAGEEAVKEFCRGLTTVPFSTSFMFCSPVEDATALDWVRPMGPVMDLSGSFPTMR